MVVVRIPALVAVVMVFSVLVAVAILMAMVVEIQIQVFTMETPARIRIQVVVQVIIRTLPGVRYAVGSTMQTNVPSFSMSVILFLLYTWLMRSTPPAM